MDFVTDGTGTASPASPCLKAHYRGRHIRLLTAFSGHPRTLIGTVRVNLLGTHAIYVGTISIQQHGRLHIKYTGLCAQHWIHRGILSIAIKNSYPTPIHSLCETQWMRPFTSCRNSAIQPATDSGRRTMMISRNLQSRPSRKWRSVPGRPDWRTLGSFLFRMPR